MEIMKRACGRGDRSLRGAAPDGSSWNRLVEKGEEGRYVLEEAAAGQEEDEEGCDQRTEDEETGSAEQQALVGVVGVTEGDEEAGEKVELETAGT
jgi:hypothetical protein